MGACRLVCSILLVLVTAAAVLSSTLLGAAEPTQRVVRVGFVSPFSPSTATRGVSAFWDRLHELGWVEGQNLVIEARWAEGRYDQLPALMAEVVGRKVDVLVTWSTPAAIAAKKVTSTVPIVDAGMGDPVRSGLVRSMARPEGNLTGLSTGIAEGMAGKWLELLQEMVPRLNTVAVIANPGNPTNRDYAKELQALAPTRGLKLLLIEVREPRTLDRDFEQAGRKAQAVLVFPDSVLAEYRWRIASFAAEHKLPAMGYVRDDVEAGMLMAYGPDFALQWRRAADHVDKILKGAKSGDLPIEQPTEFKLLVNLKTAKALGLTVPESILLRADEVIK